MDEIRRLEDFERLATGLEVVRSVGEVTVAVAQHERVGEIPVMNRIRVHALRVQRAADYFGMTDRD
jgi:hypothetical protein